MKKMVITIEVDVRTVSKDLEKNLRKNERDSDINHNWGRIRMACIRMRKMKI